LTDAVLTINHFSPYLNQPFDVVVDENHTVPFELIEVTPLQNTANQPRNPFSLLWRAPKSYIFPQGTYIFRHPVLGNLDIFIVPVGVDTTGVRYEAVFN
jgi:hypothetical protein